MSLGSVYKHVLMVTVCICGSVCVFCVSQECDEYVLNDNVAGDIKILRSCLQAMSLQSSEPSRDDDVSHRRSKRIRRSSSVAALPHDL